MTISFTHHNGGPLAKRRRRSQTDSGRPRAGGRWLNTGNPAENITLSQRRADAVRDALIKDGANPDTLVAKGYGSADPIASNDTPEGRLRNPRIEYHILKTP